MDICHYNFWLFEKRHCNLNFHKNATAILCTIHHYAFLNTYISSSTASPASLTGSLLHPLPLAAEGGEHGMGDHGGWPAGSMAALAMIRVSPALM